MIDYDLICRVARRRAKQKSGVDWRDLAQETFLCGLLGRKSTDGPMLDMMWRQPGARKQIPIRLVHLHRNVSAPIAPQSIIMPRLESALDALPAPYRSVLFLTYWRDLNRAEIAARMGVDRSRISQIHTRAIKKLREAVQ